MHYLRCEPWGYSLWKDGKQYGAGVGVPPFWRYPEPRNNQAKRIWRKHGVARIDGTEADNG